jgi:hypothetical protein
MVSYKVYNCEILYMHLRLDEYGNTYYINVNGHMARNHDNYIDDDIELKPEPFEDIKQKLKLSFLKKDINILNIQMGWCDDDRTQIHLILVIPEDFANLYAYSSQPEFYLEDLSNTEVWIKSENFDHVV